MQLNHVTILLMSLVAGTAVAAPLSSRQSSVAGQACTDGTFDGTCRADGRCGLEIPPNEVSFRFVAGQCEDGGNGNGNGNNNNNAGNGNGNGNAGNIAGGGNNNAGNGNAGNGNAGNGNAGNGNGNGNNNNNNNNNNNAGNGGASVEGDACTDGTFDGTCRADGRCGLEIPPNEVSFRFVGGQCGTEEPDTTDFDNFFGGGGADEEETEKGDPADFVGQSCTDGTFDGTCQESGRCGLDIPPNEFSQVFITGQCGQ